MNKNRLVTAILYGMDAGNLSMEKSGEGSVKNFGQLIAQTDNDAQQELHDIEDYFDYRVQSVVYQFEFFTQRRYDATIFFQQKNVAPPMFAN